MAESLPTFNSEDIISARGNEADLERGVVNQSMNMRAGLPDENQDNLRDLIYGKSNCIPEKVDMRLEQHYRDMQPIIPRNTQEFPSM